VPGATTGRRERETADDGRAQDRARIRKCTPAQTAEATAPEPAHPGRLANPAIRRHAAAIPLAISSMAVPIG
jgi:hypothetical protein